MSADLGSRACCAPADDCYSSPLPTRASGRAVEVLNLGRSMWLLGVAGWWVLMPAATLRVAQDSRLTRVEWSR